MSGSEFQPRWTSWVLMVWISAASSSRCHRSAFSPDFFQPCSLQTNREELTSSRRCSSHDLRRTSHGNLSLSRPLTTARISRRSRKGFRRRRRQFIVRPDPSPVWLSQRRTYPKNPSRQICVLRRVHKLSLVTVLLVVRSEEHTS